MGDGVDRFYGFGTYDPPATPMECGNSAALREYERSYQETDEDPLWDAEQAVREDSSVMAEELGSECMADLWAELHRLIQEPLPWNMPRDEAYRDRFIEVRDLFNRYVVLAAGNRVAGLSDYLEGER